MRKGRNGEKKTGGKDREKTEKKREQRLMIIVATMSLPAVNRQLVHKVIPRGITLSPGD